MARKKTTKRNAKRQPAKVNNTASVSHMEKEFLQVPAKIVAAMNKETVTLKKNESALKATLAKLIAQANKNTGKTLSAAAKKAQNNARKLQTAVQKELNTATKTLADAVQKQAKFSALRKHLNDFDKLWAKQAKTLKAKSKTATPAKAPKKAKAAATHSHMNPTVESHDSMTNDVNYSETAEVAS